MDQELTEYEPEPPSRLKKIFLFGGGVFLVVLIVSYIFVGFPLGDLLRGQIESVPLEGNKLDLGTYTVIFADEPLQELNKIYLSEQKVEFSVCLQGIRAGNEYQIKSLYQPVMYKQAFNHVNFAACENSIVILHSHPNKHCLASDTDLKTLKQSSAELMVVMCEPDRFSVYGGIE